LKRLRDAQFLLGDEPDDPHKRYSHARGAGYLAGYAIECKAKAIAMEVFDCWTLEELAASWDVDENQVYAHGLEAILRPLHCTTG
jgi:hypothetical protein